ncbi:MAG: insulinase family protein [Saprospiraceae bacterium]|nr:insulinase family protein [Saprospiraceae bacterium]
MPIATEFNYTKPTYDYESVPGDPLGVKIYTMDNGMKIYMSVNKLEPRVQTNIAVRAGSKHDPAETTGLAHYLEHMLFKGTSQIGALNWEKESPLLQEISDLYEKHRMETDPEKRKAIYHQIDSVSNLAATYVAANEYDKLVSAMGAKGTNAYTWMEQTVYINDIPSNELPRWFQLESERFSECVLRLFHTELEAVYEEFNIGQDRDFRKVYQVVNEVLFPTHPYGTQTTIGTSEHLKNPSHVKIQEYFNTYYVPNNMAIVLSGDFDPDMVVGMAERSFGGYKSKEVPPFTFEPQPELDRVIRRDVFGQEAEYVELDWRFNGAASKDADYITLISGLLYNGQAGLIDLNLLQKQQVLEARSGLIVYEDYADFNLYGKPREGQELADVEQLLLDQLEKIRNGEFDDWMLEAVINDFKLSEIRRNESNSARAGSMTNAFIKGVKWADYVARYDRMRAITKAELVAFAKEHFQNNYLVVYKRSGEDPNVVKVEKPTITPISVNREETSPFATRMLGMASAPLEPEFIDYQQRISTDALDSGLPFDYVQNKSNETFSLNYVFDMGRNNDKLIALAITYLPYLGTSKYTPEELKKEFFRLGLSFDVNTSNTRVYVTLSGLDESFEEGVQLFEHILDNVQGNQEALLNVIDDIMVTRANNLKDKRIILRNAMTNYARYGEDSPFTNILGEEELRSITPGDLTQIIQGITDFDHRVFYYGSLEEPKVAEVLNKYHEVPAVPTPVKKEKEFVFQDQEDTEVFFVDFPMVQAEIMMVSKGTAQFNLQEYIISELYNTYFGYGLSSIVFQEIRESRALAYSAYAYNAAPSRANQPHYFTAYVGTQVDKMPEAIAAMNEIINDMPLSDEQIESARQSILKKIETDRITGSSIYWEYLNTKERGYDYDLRKSVYEAIQNMGKEDLIRFHRDFIKDRKYSILVLGSKESIDMEYLQTLGTVKELRLEDIFGYEINP